MWCYGGIKNTEWLYGCIKIKIKHEIVWFFISAFQVTKLDFSYFQSLYSFKGCSYLLIRPFSWKSFNWGEALKLFSSTSNEFLVNTFRNLHPTYHTNWMLKLCGQSQILANLLLLHYLITEEWNCSESLKIGQLYQILLEHSELDKDGFKFKKKCKI